MKIPPDFWRDTVFVGIIGNEKLSDLLREYVDDNDEHDILDAGYCVCNFCQIFIPMAEKMEELLFEMPEVQ